MNLFVSPAIYGILIPIMDMLFTCLAKKMNDFENYDTDSNYNHNLIFKVTYNPILCFNLYIQSILEKLFNIKI